MQKVIITGSGGFIGSAVTKKLLKQGVYVYAIDINETLLSQYDQYSNCTPIILDFKNYNQLSTLIDDEIDVFYHFAWAGGFTTAIKDYKLQLLNAGYSVDAVMEAIKLRCKRFVYSGTYNEYEVQSLLNHPTVSPRYTTIYSSAKTVADLMCKTMAVNNNMEYCSGLIPMPYGEGNYSRQLTNIVIDCLNKGISPKLIEGNNLYDLVYIDDIADALISIGNKGINLKSYYIGHRNLKTFKQIITEIRDIIAPDVKLIFGEYKDNQFIDYSLVDLDELYNDTGFECQPVFKESIIKTAKWIKTLKY